MTPMIAEHQIAIFQKLGDGNANPLLTDAGVNSPEQLPLSEQIKQPLLHRANQHRLRPEINRNIVLNRPAHQQHQSEVL